MSKSLLLTVIVAVIGAVVFYQFLPTVNPAIAFVIGVMLAALIVNINSAPQAVSNENYNGPTMTLYIGNLPYKVRESEVEELFNQHGPVISVRLVRDRKTGRRKGFGFVEMSEKGAKSAMKTLNDALFQERTIKVREAKTQDSDSDKSEQA
ncbi:RNA-binding protein [Shewanella sp. NIFS-20-20]|uniref:RNA recognition motif domain-containing protein n=1 Tax=Shewanella sp. NIFS-20-20 TaxID=2853806 RepID=UPI001C464DFB|nr:RNA-binding protein [Shewanella sp. NIFS-20-20]MBV7316714.1 RNA-binding protein [Shewanella sp. NIFS-20-20]